MKALSIPLLLGIALASGPAWAQADVSKVNGSISADPGQRYGKLDTVNGGIRVGEGVETGSIDTVNGGVKSPIVPAPAASRRSMAVSAWAAT